MTPLDSVTTVSLKFSRTFLAWHAPSTCYAQFSDRPLRRKVDFGCSRGSLPEMISAFDSLTRVDSFLLSPVVQQLFEFFDLADFQLYNRHDICALHFVVKIECWKLCFGRQNFSLNSDVKMFHSALIVAIYYITCFIYGLIHNLLLIILLTCIRCAAYHWL